MHTRNDGKGESNILQNEFTAYLSVAVIRKKKDLLKKREHLQRHELSTLSLIHISEPTRP